MTQAQSIAESPTKPRPALRRAAVRFRAWWDGADPGKLVDEIAAMAEKAAAPEDSSDALSMRTRLKAWWDGSDPVAEPEAPPSAGTGKASGPAAARPAAAAPAPAKPRLRLPPEKLESLTALWGAGFREPLDKTYVPDLVKPFALNEKMTVVDLGAGLGGGTRAVAERYKVWVTGMEPDPEYAQAAMQLSIKSGMKTRAPIVAYDIDKLALAKQRFNCIYAMETFHRARNKQALFAAIANGVSVEGQVLFTDLVLRKPRAVTPEVKAWIEAEPFASHPWSGEETAAMLKQLGFDTRINEDMTAKYRRLGLLGWKECLERLAGKRPPRPVLLQLLDDAELWVRRLRALDSGALQLRRYHAFVRR
ncbi:MAG: methyltransferase domain-containing protein [Alphaproteobacteria bacterium]|nr:methyltransferase domain-containing protein [Alphaproteobacteria bacterium]